MPVFPTPMRVTRSTLPVALRAALALAGCGSAEDGTHNDADVAYASGMIVHHEQALEMSDILLAKSGVDQPVMDLAVRIKEAQGPEIERMRQWLDEWGDNDNDHDHDHDHDGMVSEEDIALLSQAPGAQASQLFLEQMIEHHEGAIEMAEEHLEEGVDEDALDLSRDVITSQTAEVEEMRSMLE